MRISLEIPEGSAAGFMARRLKEIAGAPPEEYAREAIERAAERDLAELYRLLLVEEYFDQFSVNRTATLTSPGLTI